MSSQEYHESYKSFNPLAEDGTFLMAFTDFIEVFNEMYFVINFKGQTEEEKTELIFSDSWQKQNSGGPPSMDNPEWVKNP